MGESFYIHVLAANQRDGRISFCFDQLEFPGDKETWNGMEDGWWRTVDFVPRENPIKFTGLGDEPDINKVARGGRDEDQDIRWRCQGLSLRGRVREPGQRFPGRNETLGHSEVCSRLDDREWGKNTSTLRSRSIPIMFCRWRPRIVRNHQRLS